VCAVWALRRRIARPNALRPRFYRCRHTFNTTEFAPRPAMQTVLVLRAQRAYHVALAAQALLCAS
jgi:hypothetical protein